MFKRNWFYQSPEGEDTSSGGGDSDTGIVEGGVAYDDKGAMDIEATADLLASDLGLGDPPKGGSANSATESDTPNPDKQEGQPSDTPQADAEKKAQEEAAAAAEAAKAAEPPADFPKSWKKEMAPHWNAMPAEAKAYVQEREQQMLHGIEGYKNAASAGQNFVKVVHPYMENIRAAAQGNPYLAVETLLAADHALRHGTPEQKTQLLTQMAKDYGLDLNAAVQAAQGQTPNRDPYVASLEAKVQRLEQRLNGTEQHITADQEARVQQIREQVSTEIDKFAADPAHPYFDELADDITKLINVGYTLKDAYDRAVWANPVTRAKETARIQAESAEQTRKNAEAEAAKARKASGTNVRGSAGGRSPTAARGTMDDTMNETLAAIKSRVH